MDGNSQIDYSLLDKFSDELVNVAEVSCFVVLETIVEAFPVDVAVLLHRIMHVFPSACERFFSDFFEHRERHVRLCFEARCLDEPRVLSKLENDEHCPENNGD